MSRSAGADVDRAFAAAVGEGLRAAPLAIPCRFLYDRRGAELFSAITRSEAYYPTRTELAILADRGAAIGASLPACAHLIEPGAGEGIKTECLLAALRDPARCTLVDIAGEQLAATAARLSSAFPGCEVAVHHGDFTRLGDGWDPGHRDRRVVFFPGSTIGNFEPAAAAGVLRDLARIAGEGGHLVVGFDRVKDPAVLARAYDDPDGLTAAFIGNLVTRMNRELHVGLDEDAFALRTTWDAANLRVVLELEVLRDQVAALPDGARAELPAGKRILIEYSHKYRREDIETLAAVAGCEVEACWSDEREWFTLTALRPRRSGSLPAPPRPR